MTQKLSEEYLALLAEHAHMSEEIGNRVTEVPTATLLALVERARQARALFDAASLVKAEMDDRGADNADIVHAFAEHVLPAMRKKNQ